MKKYWVAIPGNWPWKYMPYSKMLPTLPGCLGYPMFLALLGRSLPGRGLGRARRCCSHIGMDWKPAKQMPSCTLKGMKLFLALSHLPIDSHFTDTAAKKGEFVS